MVEDKRETVVVEGRRSSPVGWIIGVVVLIIVIALFFTYGGFGMFGGGSAPAGDTVNVDAPENINVQPTSGQ